METLLVLKAMEIGVPVDEQERPMLDLAVGRMDRRNLTDWRRQRLRTLA